MYSLNILKSWDKNVMKKKIQKILIKVKNDKNRKSVLYMANNINCSALKKNIIEVKREY